MKKTILLLFIVLLFSCSNNLEEVLPDKEPEIRLSEKIDKPKFYAPINSEYENEYSVEIEINKIVSLLTDLDFNRSSDLREDLAFDENSFSSFITMIEDEFDIEIYVQDYYKLRTIDDVYAYVKFRVMIFTKQYSGSITGIELTGLVPSADINLSFSCQIKYKNSNNLKPDILEFKNKDIKITTINSVDYYNIISENKSSNYQSSYYSILTECKWTAHLTLIKHINDSTIAQTKFIITHTIAFIDNLLTPAYSHTDVSQTTTFPNDSYNNNYPSSVEEIVMQIILDKMPNQELAQFLNFNSNLQKDLEFDSLDMCDFIIEIENRFNISIPDEDWQTYFNQDIREICNYIKYRL